MWERHRMTRPRFNVARLGVTAAQRKLARFPFILPTNTTHGHPTVCAPRQEGSAAIPTLKTGARIECRAVCVCDYNSRYFLPWVDPDSVSHVSIYACTRARVCAFVCVRVRVRVRVCARALRACAYTSVRARVRVCACVCARAHLRLYIGMQFITHGPH